MRAVNQMSLAGLDAARSAVRATTRRRKTTSRPRRSSTGPHPLAGTIPTPEPGVHRLTYEARPWTLNVERQGTTSSWKTARLTAEWRKAFHDLALEAKVPRMTAVAVTVRPELRHAGGIPDTGACIGAAKAGIDGIVDAGVLPDDSPQYVRRLSFEAPVITGRDALNLDVEAVAA